MKKFFTLALGMALTAAVFAADKRPDVTISSAKKYEIVVDGRTYSSGNRTIDIQDLRNGRHTIQVYKASNNRFSIFKRKQLVASSSFQLKNRDMNINIDRFGRISMTEDRFGGNDWGNQGKDQKGWDQKGSDRNGRDNGDRRF
jgi:hypothetical protein